MMDASFSPDIRKDRALSAANLYFQLKKSSLFHFYLLTSFWKSDILIVIIMCWSSIHLNV